MGLIPGVPEDPNAALQFYAQLISQNPNCAEVYYELGDLLQKVSAEMHSDQAVSCWLKAFELKPDWREVYPTWVSALRVIGGKILHKEDRYDEGMAVIKEMLVTERELARRHPLGKYGFRFLSNYNNPQHLGHAALEPDLFLKMTMLGWQEEFKPILLVEGRVANPTLLEYWKKYIHVVTDPVHVQSLLPLRPFLRHETWYTLFPDGQVKDAISAMCRVQKEWEAQKRAPLLALTDFDRDRGGKCLEQMGLPKDAWFVCLHVREPGYYQESASTQTGAFRNADIYTYEKAIKSITARGGWVVRVGDATMKPLPPMPQVVDYAKSPFKSDWMDIFLCASCKFFLGTTSGLMNIPSVFGVPCALTNWSVFFSLPCFPSDLFIAKLPYSDTEKRHFKWMEMVTPPLAFAQDDRLKALGFRAIDNTPEEIDELAIEMLDGIEGKAVYTPDDTALQVRAKKIFDSKFSAGSACRMGRDFLRRHSNLLPE